MTQLSQRTWLPMMTALLALPLLVILWASLAAGDDSSAGAREVQLVSEDLDLRFWHATVSGFVMAHGLECSVAPVGTAGISIKGGTAAERELVVRVARVFGADDAGGSRATREHSVALPEELSEGLWARRTDFARVEDAGVAFPQVRDLLLSPLPGVRKVSVYRLGNRVVTIGGG